MSLNRRHVLRFRRCTIICICIPLGFTFWEILLIRARQQQSLDAAAWNESRLQFKSVGDYYFAVTPKDDTPRFEWPLPLNFRQGSCLEFAKSVEEPRSARYHPRLTAVSSFGENVPRAYWRWPGNITKADFESAAAKEWPGCIHCMNLVRYKVLGRKLYVVETAPEGRSRKSAEEMLQVVLYLFPIPDMEFLLHFGDGCTNGLPVISWNVCRQFADAGFTMPSYGSWLRSLGPTQLLALSTCMKERYPPSKRKPVVIWRGSTTDKHLREFTKDNYLKALRIQLHMFARNYTDILDVRIARHKYCDDYVKAQINDTGSWIDFEHFNEYCAVLDIDGNGWSDRFREFVRWNTPVLKMESTMAAYFEHLFAPDVGVAKFKSDFSDLPEKARQLIADCTEAAHGGKAGEMVHRITKNMQATSLALLDQVGVTEAFAYTLFVYKNLSSWEVDPSLQGFKQANATCCTIATVPKWLATAVEEHHGRHWTPSQTHHRLTLAN